MANATQKALKKVKESYKLQGYSKEVGHEAIHGSPEKFVAPDNKKGSSDKKESPKGASMPHSKQGGVKAPKKDREEAVPKSIAESAKSRGSLASKIEAKKKKA